MNCSLSAKIETAEAESTFENLKLLEKKYKFVCSQVAQLKENSHAGLKAIEEVVTLLAGGSTKNEEKVVVSYMRGKEGELKDIIGAFKELRV